MGRRECDGGTVTDPVSAVWKNLAYSLARSPFQQLLGLSLEDIDTRARTVTIRCTYGPCVERAPASAQYHGGVIASLIDIAGDYAVMAVIGRGVPTINFRVDYLRPAFSSNLLARGQVRKMGRTLGVVDVDVLDGVDRAALIAETARLFRAADHPRAAREPQGR